MSQALAYCAAALGSGMLTGALALQSARAHAHRSLRWWTGAFAANTFCHAAPFLASFIGPTAAGLIGESLFAIFLMLLLAGTLRFVERPVPMGWLAAGWLVGLAWLWLLTFTETDSQVRLIPLSVAAAVILIATGWAFYRQSIAQPGLGYRLVAFAAGVWALHALTYPYTQAAVWVAPFQAVIAGGLSSMIALALIIVEQRRQEAALRIACEALGQSEQRLRQNEARFRDFAEATSDWFWETDADLRFSQLSEGSGRRSSASDLLALGKRPTDIIDPTFQPEQIRAVLEDMKQRRPFRDFRYRSLLFKHRPRYFSVSGRPFFDAEGRFQGYRGSARDVTADLANEEAAGRQTRLLQAIIDNMPMGVSLVDHESNMLAFNQRMLDLLEFPRDRFRPGDPFEKFLRFNAERGEYGPGDPETLVQARLELARHPVAHRIERVRPDGTVVEVIGAPLPDGGFVTTYADVTEHRRMEDRFRDFAEATSDWFWEQDADLRFTYLSPSVYEISGLRPEDHYGRTREETLLIGVDEERWAQHRADLAARRPFRNFVFQRYDLRGRLHHLAISGKPNFDETGRFVGYRGTGRDITAEIQSEARARQAEAYLAHAIEVLSDALAIYDHNDRLVTCNAAYRRLFGKVSDLVQPGMAFEELARLIAENNIELMTTEDRDIWVAARLDFHRHPANPLIVRLVTGQWLQVREQRLDDGGSILVAADITEIKANERALSEKSNLLQKTLESMGEGLSVYDRDHRLVAWNDRWIDMTGIPRPLLRIGVMLEDVLRWQIASGEFGAVDPDEELKRHRAQFLGSTPLLIERLRPNGRVLQIRRNPMPDGGTVSIYADVTEAKQHEQLLAEKTALLETTFHTVDEGISVWDRDLRLQAWNEQVPLLLGLPGDLYFPGAALPDIILARFQRGDRMIGGESDAFQEGSDLSGDPELELKRYLVSLQQNSAGRHAAWLPNGRYVETRRTPLPGGGFVFVMSDFSDHERSKNALRQAKEAAEIANRTKSQFLANMSHELRTPLNAVIGFSEIIEQELFGPLGSDRYREYMRDIRESGMHLLELINDILDVSKAEAGQIELWESIVNVDSMIRASLRLVDDRAKEARIHLLKPKPRELPAIRCDERRLKQVMLNLLSNAIKFTPAGGKVSVDAEADQCHGLRIRIADTGVGIAPADIPKAMQLFGQLENAFARKHNGTGLGLPLTRALVELHGGHLDIESQVGVGTTVTVALPPDRLVLAS